jgi:hypothetical protein
MIIAPLLPEKSAAKAGFSRTRPFRMIRFIIPHEGNERNRAARFLSVRKKAEKQKTGDPRFPAPWYNKGKSERI